MSAFFYSEAKPLLKYIMVLKIYVTTALSWSYTNFYVPRHGTYVP